MRYLVTSLILAVAFVGLWVASFVVQALVDLLRGPAIEYSASSVLLLALCVLILLIALCLRAAVQRSPQGRRLSLPDSILAACGATLIASVRAFDLSQRMFILGAISIIAIGVLAYRRFVRL